ncbi:hypothetical protein A2334_02735 [Candidatus Roizmanbacteria bacterium RIFOXYB2_FULL_38_10]|uniref:Uncharacterized protein n=1 Tax=Candidatus Roizmanbacteria bacterium RIFOXYD1_FULL_38_12 TaxID=1802093 RepID=A0A1F7L0B9_9BACT|nr:MAG: hypothetical protein A3K47_02265 [Candidatus Roizmanbacteria bacterium RIFOXYA2_FULL_38_14]OGK63602.1 MAG: hypothetical protein A3K27_02265 [Candidatus Roizmanbacteria bacterium RIFOXYA1_FULL_37_12]OGK65448.1 MAG: hypothetical protein A3K38_02265 [Candidatus Roizmanbacteria bacterium RIFOXYB1_FULL_40_23]OGK69075.1 MAG: hypothetical protein A2334_02735 [Candidatus Roizmanbacteria bacterium RIFOXYB2_FULL_38_10]OGK69853.1 MAG: hypothetical protein A3K21_02270 [Candidatus Roizmanbacteria ba
MNKRLKNILVIIFFLLLIAAIIAIGIYSQKTTSINSKANVNSVRKVNGITYYFDAMGRVRKTVTSSGFVTYYYYDAAGNYIGNSNSPTKPPPPRTTPISN